MKTEGLIKTFDAGGTLPARRIVKFGSAEETVVVATAVGDALIGVSVDVDAANGDLVDVVLSGIAQVEYGGNVTRGALLTTDTAGKAVAAAPAGGANNSVIGRAMVSGASGDYGYVLLAPGQIQGAA